MVRPVSVLAVSLLVPLGGCGNYDFRRALGPDGNLDLSLLKADASREGPLHQASWFPLVHRNQTSCQWRGEAPPPDIFELASAYPAGLTILALRGYGPFYAYFHRREARYDTTLAPYETIEATGVLWRLWARGRCRVKVSGGIREEVRTELFFGVLKLPTIVRYLPERP